MVLIIIFVNIVCTYYFPPSEYGDLWKQKVSKHLQPYVIPLDEETVKYDINKIVETIYNAPRINQNIIVFRGITTNERLEVLGCDEKFSQCKDFTAQDITSTTTWFLVAQKFARQRNPGRIIEIHIPPNFPLLYYPGSEFEIILPPNTKHHFLGTRKVIFETELLVYELIYENSIF